MEVAVPSFALPHGCGVQAKGRVQLGQVRFIWAAVLVVLVPDYHVLQAVHIASPPCAHRAGVGVRGRVGHPWPHGPQNYLGLLAPRDCDNLELCLGLFQVYR